MTESTKTIFEKYQVRKSKKQKRAFIEYVKEESGALGYDCKVEKGLFGAKNIVLGDVDKANVIYTAHYDTCPRLPFPNFITPKNFFIYLLYQIAIVVGFFVVSGALGFCIGFVSAYLDIGFDMSVIIIDFLILLFLALLLFGPANKNTANDNTSGVTTLLDLMRELPEELRDSVAFVFFDLEETGLFGSASFASKHKAIAKNTLIVNFDCVSDGNNILFALGKGAKGYTKALGEAFPSNEDFSVEVASKGVFYPSDQMNFKRGVGVAALKKTAHGLLYMNRIHTKKDTVYCEENIDFLVKGAIELAEKLK